MTRHRLVDGSDQGDSPSVIYVLLPVLSANFNKERE